MEKQYSPIFYYSSSFEELYPGSPGSPSSDITDPNFLVEDLKIQEIDIGIQATEMWEDLKAAYIACCRHFQNHIRDIDFPAHSDFESKAIRWGQLESDFIDCWWRFNDNVVCIQPWWYEENNFPVCETVQYIWDAYGDMRAKVEQIHQCIIVIGRAVRGREYQKKK